MERIHRSHAAVARPAAASSQREAIRKSLEGENGTLNRTALVNLLEGKNTGLKYLAMQASVEIAGESGLMLRDLADLASRHGLDLARCGFRVAKPVAQAGDSVVAAGDGTMPPRRALENVMTIAAESHDLAEAFHRNGTETTLRAFGQLAPAEVEAALRRRLGKLDQTRPALENACFQAFTGQVIATILAPIKDAGKVIAALAERPELGRQFMGRFTTETARFHGLRAIGVREEAATSLARSWGKGNLAQDRALAQAVKQAEKDLAWVHCLVYSSDRYEERALALFEQFPQVVRQVRAELSIRDGSFVDHTVQRGLARGAKIERERKMMKTATGLVSSVIVTAATGGMGAAIAPKLIKGVLFKAQEVVTAHNKRLLASVGEGVGLAPPGAARRAARAERDTLRKAAFEVGASVAVSAGIRRLVTALPIQHLIRPELGDDVLLAAGKFATTQAATEALKHAAARR